jgi:hypothetical protein
MNTETRRIVHDKYNGRCAYCGCLLPNKWHVDHLIPIKRTRAYDKTKGKWIVIGCDNPDMDCLNNMMPACPSCNINKHSDSIEKFRDNIKGYLKSLNDRIVQYQMVRRYSLVKETNNDVIFYFEKHQQIEQDKTFSKGGVLNSLSSYNI